MDKLKGLGKGGWHPSGDPSISRKTWKSDLKGMATGKKNDPNEQKLNHESRPLASLRDRECVWNVQLDFELTGERSLIFRTSS